LDENHGILSISDRFKYAVTQPGLLFALSACIRSAVLLGGACAVLLEKHSRVLSFVVDLTSLLLQFVNQSPHDDESMESMKKESETKQQVRMQVLQSLSILLNAMHFLPQYLEMHDFSFTSSSSSSSQQQQQQRRAYEMERLSQSRWTDVQSRVIWYMVCTQLLVGTIEYLQSFSTAFLQHQWDKQKTTTTTVDTNNIDSDKYGKSSIEILQLDLQSNPNGRTDGFQNEQLLGEYEMLCGGLELCWSMASYLRQSAGVSDFTLVRDIDQLRSRRHRHPRGRQMLSVLAGGSCHSSLLAVLSQLLSVTYRLPTHTSSTSDTITPADTSDAFSASLQKVEMVWSLPIPSTETINSASVSDPLNTVLVLVTDTLCALTEADIGLHRGLAKQSRAELVAHLGALLAVYSSSSSSSSSSALISIRNSVLRLLSQIYLSSSTEPMQSRSVCNAYTENQSILLTRQEGLFLSKPVLTRLQDMLLVSSKTHVGFTDNKTEYGSQQLETDVLIRAVLLSLLHSCDLLSTLSVDTSSSPPDYISVSTVCSIREYFQLRRQELKQQQQGAKPTTSPVLMIDCANNPNSSMLLALLSHVAPASIWPSTHTYTTELNQVM
jgi:hypothetical protein